MLTLPAYAGQVTPDEGSLASAYDLTFYIEPSLSAGASYCFTFTTTGFLSGYPHSGTYTDNTGDFTGTWYVNGDEVMLSGVYTLGDSIPMIGRLLGPGSGKFGGRFLDFFSTNTNAAIADGGTFVATKVASCPSVVAKRSAPNATAPSAN
jgi:hypothetical protein